MAGSTAGKATEDTPLLGLSVKVTNAMVTGAEVRLLL